MEKKKSPLIIIIVLIVLGFIGYKIYLELTINELDEPLMVKEEDRLFVNNKPQGDPPPSEPPAGTEGYTPGRGLSDVHKQYSQSEVEAAFEEGKRVLLFFTASWCPTCQGAKRDIAKNYMDLPEDLVIFELDYDTEKALKDEYSVVVQHTFVQIDETGDQITTWNGGGVGAIIDNIE